MHVRVQLNIRHTCYGSTRCTSLLTHGTHSHTQKHEATTKSGLSAAPVGQNACHVSHMEEGQAHKSGGAAHSRRDKANAFQTFGSNCDRELKDMIKGILHRALPATRLPPPGERQPVKLPPESEPASSLEPYVLECSGERRPAANWPWDAQDKEAWKHNATQDRIMLERHRRAVNTSLSVAWCVCVCVWCVCVCARARMRARTCVDVCAWTRRAVRANVRKKKASARALSHSQTGPCDTPKPQS